MVPENHQYGTEEAECGLWARSDSAPARTQPFLGVLMERAKSSVFDLIHAEGSIDSLTFEHRVNIALQLSMGLKVCLPYDFCVNPFRFLAFTFTSASS